MKKLFTFLLLLLSFSIFSQSYSVIEKTAYSINGLRDFSFDEKGNLWINDSKSISQYSALTPTITSRKLLFSFPTNIDDDLFLNVKSNKDVLFFAKGFGNFLYKNNLGTTESTTLITFPVNNTIPNYYRIDSLNKEISILSNPVGGESTTLTLDVYDFSGKIVRNPFSKKQMYGMTATNDGTGNYYLLQENGSYKYRMDVYDKTFKLLSGFDLDLSTSNNYPIGTLTDAQGVIHMAVINTSKDATNGIGIYAFDNKGKTLASLININKYADPFVKPTSYLLQSYGGSMYIGDKVNNQIIRVDYASSNLKTTNLIAADIIKSTSDGNFQLMPSSNSTAKFNYSLVNGDAVNVDVNGIVKILKIGTAKIKISQIETGGFAAAEKTINITINPPTIKQARQTPIAQTATVYGRITANNQFGTTVFLQDATAGIAVFSDTLSKSVQVGDSVSVTGTTALFNGLFQLSGKVSFQKFAGAAKVITPLPIKLSEMRLYESQLVSIKDLELVDKKFVFVPNTNYAVSQFVKGSSTTVKDTTFSGEIRIVTTTNLIGRTKPQSVANVTGIISQFNGLYQFQPRSQEDMPTTQAATRTTQGVAYDKTFDLVAWNTNWLGNKSNGPTNEPLQQANFKRVLDSLQADIFVFEEVANQQFYRDFVAQYTNYKGFCSSTYSLVGAADDAQRVCFLYKKGVVDSVSARPLLKNATPLPNYPSDPARFWASGRLPFIFTADVNIDGVKKRVNIVGLHARANTSASTNTLAERELQYRQRRYDVEVLKDSLDKFYPYDNLFIVGDYNDDVDETVSVITSTTESSYKKYVDDTKNYQVITKALSDNGYRTYLSQNNVIDHIMVSNELTNTYLQNSVNVELPFMYLANYTTTTSDHIPVLARFQFIINAPSEMMANVIDYQGINLTWKDNTSDEKGFELERSVDNKIFVKISDVVANTTAFSDKKLEANKKYYYRVRAITSEGTSKYATAEATTAVILGEEPDTQTFFKISPNPSNGVVNITLNDPTLNNAILNVSLMTIDGKIITQTEGKLAEINTEINTTLPKRATGTYLLRLEVKDKVGVLKVVKE